MNDDQEQTTRQFDAGVKFLSSGDFDAAFEIFSGLAASRYVKSYLQLGLIYLGVRELEIKCSKITGLTDDELEIQAEFNFRSGAGFDDSECWYQLGILLCNRYYGRGSGSILEAVDWLVKAANKGHKKSQLEAAHTLTGMKHYREAFEFCSMAATSGDGEACYYLAMAHFANRTSPPDFRAPIFSFTPEIQHRRTENYKRGVSLMRRSAEAGYLEAEYRWGLLLKAGLGVPTITILEKDEQAGHKFILKAAKRGYPKAIKAIQEEPQDHPYMRFG